QAGAAHAFGLHVASPDVTEGGGVDAAFAVGGGPFERPVHLGDRVETGREHLKIFGGAAGVVVDFDVGRLPRAGQPGVDRVVAATMDDRVEAVAVTGVATVPGRDADEAAVGFDCDRRAELLFAPAEADHRVVGRPVGKGIVAAVPDVE